MEHQLNRSPTIDELHSQASKLGITATSRTSPVTRITVTILVSIKKAVDSPASRMPFAATTVHALLQIVTVALGSPLGREVAPREIGAALAGWLSDRAGLAAEDSRIMVACGAGAGLAAVYNVPIGGALFALEVLLGTFDLSAVIIAL